MGTMIKEAIFVAVDYIQLGKNIKRYRKLADMTQEQLANSTGYTDSHIGQIENAYGIPSFEAICRIAYALDVSLDQISYGVTQNTDGYFIQEMLRISKEFDDNQKNFVINMMLALAEQLKIYFDSQKGKV